MSDMVRVLTVILVCGASAACAERPGEPVSVRATIADWIAPPGYTPDGGPVKPLVNPYAQQQSAIVENAYQSDVARQQAGAQSVNVSQVTVIATGGQVNANVGGGFSLETAWRPAGGVASVTVAECESAMVTVPRADKLGGAMIFLTRVNGIIFVTPNGTSGCQIPHGAQSYPGYGRFPLQVQGKVQGATIQIAPWGSAPTMGGAGYGGPYDPYGNPQTRPH